MTGQRHHTTDTEAVALFHDVKSLQAAIDELLTSGFDQGCLSVLGNEKAIGGQAWSQLRVHKRFGGQSQCAESHMGTR